MGYASENMNVPGSGYGLLLKTDLQGNPYFRRKWDREATDLLNRITLGSERLVVLGVEAKLKAAHPKDSSVEFWLLSFDLNGFLMKEKRLTESYLDLIQMDSSIFFLAAPDIKAEEVRVEVKQLGRNLNTVRTFSAAQGNMSALEPGKIRSRGDDFLVFGRMENVWARWFDRKGRLKNDLSSLFEKYAWTGDFVSTGNGDYLISRTFPGIEQDAGVCEIEVVKLSMESVKS